jgi:hypothetical protein
MTKRRSDREASGLNENGALPGGLSTPLDPRSNYVVELPFNPWLRPDHRRPCRTARTPGLRPEMTDNSSGSHSPSRMAPI